MTTEPFLFNTLAREQTPTIADFSLSPEPIRFRINDDIFECAPEIPFKFITEISSMANAESTNAQLERFLNFIANLMHPESAARFTERLSSVTEPIGVRHIKQIMPWLLERYGLRPTMPSSDSAAGSSDGDTISTDTVSPTESTSQS